MTKSAGSASLLRQLAHLIPIVVALILRSLVGVFFGKSMWIATDLPTARAESLRQSIVAIDKSLADADETEKVHRVAQRDQLNADLADVEQILADKAANPPSSWALVAYRTLKFLGELFLQVLKLLVLPLVVTSMIAGIGGLGDIRSLGRMGWVTMLYFAITTAIAVVIGLVLVEVIAPGKSASDAVVYSDDRLAAKQNLDIAETILHLIIGSDKEPGSGMVPGNLVQAAYNLNILGLIVFALALGAAITTLGERGRSVIEFFATLNEAILQMVRWVMHFAPVGIFGLVAGNIASKGGGEAFLEQVRRLGWYVATVSVGLAIQFAILLLILSLVGRNPFVYLVGVARALLTAFSTASSSATLPLSIECVEDNNRISRQSANFVLPLGATVNMNGTALYEAIAAVFIAQTLGIQLDLGQLVVVFITSTLAAVGAAGIPEAGLVTMVMVLTAVGLPTNGVGIILAIDWFLDRLRTTVNVFGDMVGAAVTDRLVPETHRGDLGTGRAKESTA